MHTSVGNFDYIRQRVTTLEHFAAMTYSSFNLADEGDLNVCPDNE